MNDIFKCLDSLTAIDDAVVDAEACVVESLCVYDYKVNEMMKYSKDTESTYAYIQEASVGTGVVKDPSANIFRKMWTVIRKFFLAIFNKLSDLLVKITVNKYDYVEIPMPLKDLIQEVEDITSIEDAIVKTIDVNRDMTSNFSDLSAEIKELISKAKGLRILKENKNPNIRYGVKPDAFMKIRDKLRYLKTHMNDMRKSLDRRVAASEKLTPDLISDSYKEYVNNIQQLYSVLANASTKLFAGFKFSGNDKNENDATTFIEAYFQEDSGMSLGEFIGLVVIVSGYRMMLFVKNLFRMIQNLFKYIIEKISDWLLKMKIGNYEYVQSPLSVDDIKSDVEKLTKSMQAAMDSFDMYRSYKYDKAKLHELLKQTEEDIKTMKIFAVDVNSTKYKITPKEFIDCRKVFRYYADVAKTNKKFIDKQYEKLLEVLEIEGRKEDSELTRSDIEVRVIQEEKKDFLETSQKIWTKVTEASAKFLSSFNFSTAKKAEDDETDKEK